MIKQYEDGIMVLEWGYGDIWVVAARVVETNQPAVCFLEGQPGEIGRELPEAKGKPDTELGVRLRFIFNKPESIDIIIEELQEAKSYFKNDIT